MGNPFPHLQWRVLEQSLVVRRDTKGLNSNIQRVGPLLIAGRYRRLRAAELSTVAMRQLLPFLVLGRPTLNLDILENFLSLPSGETLSARLRRGHLQTIRRYASGITLLNE